MPITPTLAQLGGGAPGLGDMLSKQQQDEEEERRRRKQFGLSPAADQSPNIRSLMAGINQFNLGGFR
jgi:hypothetical protein